MKGLVSLLAATILGASSVHAADICRRDCIQEVGSSKEQCYEAGPILTTEQCYKTIDGITVVMFKKSRVSVGNMPGFFMIIRNDYGKPDCTDIKDPYRDFPAYGPKTYIDCKQGEYPIIISGCIKLSSKPSKNTLIFDKMKR